MTAFTRNKNKAFAHEPEVDFCNEIIEALTLAGAGLLFNLVL
jgi:hypothetical protein